MSVAQAPITPELRRQQSVGRPALAIIERNATGGVAYVARLIERALQPLAGDDPVVISLGELHPGRVSAARKLRFTGRVFANNALRRVDWVYFAHPGIASAQRLVPSALRKPYVVQLHGTDAWEEPPSIALQQATLRIAPSQYTIDRTQQSFPEIGAIALCPHGLLPFEPPTGAVDDELLARIGPASALIIGRLLSTERRKGHDELLECWSAVRSRRPGAQLVIAGDGDDAQRLRRKAEALGISDGVLFTGYVSDATREALLKRATVFAMPSQQEGFGLVYLEAMRAGLPCIAAHDDGATEPIIDGVTGVLVRHGDARELVDAIVGLFDNAELRNGLGEAGQRRFETTYTFEAYQERLLALLHDRLPPMSRKRPMQLAR